MERPKELSTEPEPRELSHENIAKFGKIAANFVRDGEKNSNREEDARADLAYWAEEYRAAELAFLKRENKVSQNEYEKWEDDAKQSFTKIEKLENDCNFKSLYEKDAAERLAAVDGRESIEAYAGNFYEERNRNLVNAIMNTDGDDKEDDKSIVGELHQLVASYIYASRDSEMRHMDPLTYQSRRQSRHNAVIRRINEINQLAEKYGVKRLTFRDFKTNDFPYNERLDYTGETNARAEYDRSAVESYIRTAFSSDFHDSEKSDSNTNYNPHKSIVAQFHTRD